jgi:molybdenum cofactor synthesis domain-containing protein
MSEHPLGRHSAAIILVGSELVEGTVRDLNGQWLTERLQSRGIWPRVMTTVSDDEWLIAQTVRAACASVNYVVVCGGLGCTPDDLTRRAVSAAFGVPMVVNPEHASALEQTSSWARGDLAYAAATLPLGAEIVVGHQDGVRGFLIENVLVLPGNPPEMQAMFTAFIRDYPPPDAPINRLTLTVDATEDVLRPRLEEFESLFPDVEMGSYADPLRMPAEVTLVLRSRDGRRLREAQAWFGWSSLGKRERI